VDSIHVNHLYPNAELLLDTSVEVEAGRIFVRNSTRFSFNAARNQEKGRRADSVGKMCEARIEAGHWYRIPNYFKVSGQTVEE